MSRNQRQLQTILQKRERYIKKMREQQRQEIFVANRQWNKDPPTVALIPFMLQQKNFENFEDVIDSIQQESLYLVDQNFKAFVQEQIRTTSSPLIQKHLFRLTNRLKIQSSEWLGQAIDKHAKEDSSEQAELLIKQIAYHLDQNYQTNYCKSQYLNQIILQDIGKKALTTDMLFYRLQIACKIQFPQKKQQKIQEYEAWLNSFLTLANQGLASDEQMVTVRVIQILLRLNPNQQNGVKIANMKHFSKLITMCLQETPQTEIVMKCIQILAELLAGSQAAFGQVVKHKQLLSVYDRYMGHIYDHIRLKVYWSLANIAASQSFARILKKMIPLIYGNLLIESKQRIKMEIRFVLLNYMCNLQVEDAVDAVTANEWIFQFLRESLEEVKQHFLSRTLFAIYSIICKVPKSRVKFEEAGIKKVLQKLYNQQQDQELSKMIQNTIEKLGGQENEQSRNQLTSAEKK